MLQRPRTSRLLCDFDSSVAAVRATGRFLRGQDFRALGAGPWVTRMAGPVSRLPLARVPVGWRRRAMERAGHLQSSPASAVLRLRAEDLASWTVSQYGPGPYPAVFLGSVSGAAVHLAAAMRAPVLPQTFLLPVRARLDPDRPRAAMAAGLEYGRRLVEADPDLSLTHMHDPSQDRAMLTRFLYFRVKRLRLGHVLARFLAERLSPGGTIYLLDCSLTWPTTLLGDRHRFQFGALGGMSRDEYVNGSERLARHLAAQGASVRQWDPPAPTEPYPEAEWGYDDTLTGEVTALAERHGLRVCRIRIGEPEHLSPLVAELHRWWYRRLGVPGDRLLVETYNQWEPYGALRVGAVPFWAQFTTRPSYRWVHHYLLHARPYRNVGVNLFSNGLRSVGHVPAAEWGALARRFATATGGTLGVDEQAYPLDVASTFRFGPALAALPERHPLPEPLRPEELDAFLAEDGGPEVCRLARFETLRAAAD